MVAPMEWYEGYEDPDDEKAARLYREQRCNALGIQIAILIALVTAVLLVFTFVGYY